VLHYYVDRSANEAFISTASQKESILRIAKMLGYTPTSTTPAIVSLIFKNSTSSNITVPAKTQIGSTTIINGSSTQVIFETDEAIVVTPDTVSPSGVSVLATQGYTVSNELIGTSDGTANQIFELDETPVIQNSIDILVNSTPYRNVQYLIEQGGGDAVFVVSTNADGITSVEFGDGVGGRVPTTNGQIYVTYRVGGGTFGNVSSGTTKNILTNYTPGLSVTNTEAASGGTDEESIESIRTNAPLTLSAGDRAVSLDDYSALAVQVTGVAKAIADAETPTSVNLYIAPFGDRGLTVGNELTEVFANISTRVIDFITPKMPPGTSITVFPPTFVGVNIEVVINALPQWKNSTVETNAVKSLNEILAFDNVAFKDRISLSYVLSALANTPGVNYTTPILLARADGAQSGTADAEFAVDELPEAGTITVSVTGGIA
jgi:predicted phage baseplate assembly protein